MGTAVGASVGIRVGPAVGNADGALVEIPSAAKTLTDTLEI